MDVFSTSHKARETYSVELKHSLLWEAALGIAALTNSALIDTLELSKQRREGMMQSMSQDMLKHLDDVHTYNTWKTLLQLLHQEDFEDLASFTSYVKKLSASELRHIAIPYLGRHNEELRHQAAQGSKEAVKQLQLYTKDNPFFPAYIEFVSDVEIKWLKGHLIEVMAGWLTAVIEPEQSMLQSILTRDVEAKAAMKQKLTPEQFVEWATNGIQYRPEPSVHQVLLIPQSIYRPWNVEADLEGVKVFYYPVANESIHPENRYMPDAMLVQKYKALGDENRLIMLKMLKERSLSLQELTQKMEMGKTTVHHHLKLLKSARLVTSDGAKYIVNGAALRSLTSELDHYLGVNGGEL
ncbi:helix-turn-helix transcriptional regulator [Thalassobacillus sp. CUG 92003]|uniref:ArsR/SmtB family transcription factor n=1 Tax=Thalassobacillus sp. CUG 92003 TaxID=2736641 RepID=UPI0015E7A144|nr:metalloregulator ArsR/SmtB family transcription factor [Thalassobacillus sp. CUG 92003]